MMQNTPEDVQVSIQIPIDVQVAILRISAATNPDDTKRVLKLGVLAALTDPIGGEEQFIALMTLMEELWGRKEANDFIQMLTITLMSGGDPESLL